LPHSFNPDSGFIATANHKMIPDNYPYHVGYEWAAPYRITRITQRLQAAAGSHRKLTMDDMQNLQTDVVSLPARELLHLLQPLAGDHPDGATQMLLSWNGVLDRESGAAALYEVWMDQLITAVTHKVAPESVWKIVEDQSPLRTLRELSHPRPEVFGDNPAVARDRLLLDTLKAAVTRLTSLEGRDASNWTWGVLHVARLRHPLDQVPQSQALLDRGPVRRPGDETTVNATGSAEHSFEQVSGASYREILDLSNWDASMAMNSPGQSGQPGSPHYSDLLRAWDEGGYFPLLYSRDAVQQQATEKLELIPQ
jgi:penicillin amidase